MAERHGVPVRGQPACGRVRDAPSIGGRATKIGIAGLGSERSSQIGAPWRITVAGTPPAEDPGAPL
jgi:hypothetical protein